MIAAVVAKPYNYPGFFRRAFTGNDCCTAAALVMSLLLSTLAASQVGSSPADAEKVVVPGMSGTVRYTEIVQVPRKGKASIAVHAELSRWDSRNGSREITIPPRVFYIVTLLNDSATTVINGEEAQRTAGEMWAVRDGQSMTIKIQEPRQENVSLEILSLRPGR